MISNVWQKQNLFYSEHQRARRVEGRGWEWTWNEIWKNGKQTVLTLIWVIGHSRISFPRVSHQIDDGLTTRHWEQATRFSDKIYTENFFSAADALAIVQRRLSRFEKVEITVFSFEKAVDEYSWKANIKVDHDNIPMFCLAKTKVMPLWFRCFLDITSC